MELVLCDYVDCELPNWTQYSDMMRNTTRTFAAVFRTKCKLHQDNSSHFYVQMPPASTFTAIADVTNCMPAL